MIVSIRRRGFFRRTYEIEVNNFTIACLVRRIICEVRTECHNDC